MFDKSFLGDGGFFWFVGKVESRQDPLGTGRVQLRAYGTHSASLTDIPSADLPWATVNNTNPPLDLRENDLVFGFWADDYNKQIPVVVGKLVGYVTEPNNQGQGFGDQRQSSVLQSAPRQPVSISYSYDGSGVTVKNPSSAQVYPTPAQINKPNLSGATRYDIANTVIQTRINNLDKGVVTANGITWSEPVPAYNALYPYNHAYESESGHLIEYDDTPGNERIAFTHRVGSFIELYPSGSRVEKVTKSNYSVVMGDDYVHVMGRVLLTVGQGAYIKVLGAANIEVGGDTNLSSGGNINLGAAGDVNIVATNFNVQAEQSTIVTQGNQLYTSQGQLELFSAAQIDLGAPEVNVELGAAQGTPNSLQKPSSGSTPNSGKAGPEQTPTPWPQNYQYLNAYTATAAKQAGFLGADGSAPDASVANAQCSFDVNTHTFLPSSAWAISQNGILQIQQREGYAKALANGYCQAYPDPVIGPALLTIGYGTTNAVLPSADAINPTTCISPTQAQQYLLDAVNNIFLPYLKEVVTVDLTQSMVDAMLSFMYNVGVGNFSKSSVLKYSNLQNWCAAGASFPLWNKSDGRVVSGLTTRRQAERSQFLA